MGDVQGLSAQDRMNSYVHVYVQTCKIDLSHVLKEFSMQRKMTITMDEAVYAGLHRVIGRGNISQFLEGLARPHVLTENSLDAGYMAMAADKTRTTGN